MSTAFTKRLNYASLNEDWRTEREALRIGAGDRVLCVTGSGARSLVLLEDDPEHILSIDLNPCQGHLLELKRVALRALTPRRLRAFLGLDEADDRIAVLQRLAPALPADARAFWLRHADLVRRGVLYEGRWERHHRRLARIAQALRGRTIRRLFAFDDLAAQRDFVRRTWDRAWWRALLRVLCSPRLARVLLADPAFHAHVGVDGGVGRYVHARMLRSLEHHLARRNFMLSLILRGRLDDGDLPGHLGGETHATLRSRLDRIERRTGDVIACMQAAPAGSFTRFSLSDLPSYLDAAGFERLLHAMAHAAAPGARFCIRQFLTTYDVPSSAAGFLAREPELEARLERTDRSFAYRFLVGRVLP